MILKPGDYDRVEQLLTGPIVEIGKILQKVDAMEAKVAMIPDLRVAYDRSVAAQESYANSANRVAISIEKQRSDYKELVKDSRESYPKDVIFHLLKWVIVVSSLPSFLLATLAVLYTLSVTKQEISAKIDGVSVVQTQNRAKTKEELEKVKQEVSKVAEEVNVDAKGRETRKEQHDR